MHCWQAGATQLVLHINVSYMTFVITPRRTCAGCAGGLWYLFLCVYVCLSLCVSVCTTLAATSLISTLKMRYVGAYRFSRFLTSIKPSVQKLWREKANILMSMY